MSVKRRVRHVTILSAATVAMVIVLGCADILGFGPSVEVDIRHIETATWVDGTTIHLLEARIKNNTKEPLEYPVYGMPNPLAWEAALRWVPNFTVERRVESGGQYGWEDVHDVCQLWSGRTTLMRLEADRSRRDTAIVRVSGRMRAVMPVRSFDGSGWSPMFSVRSNEITLP